MHGLVQDLSYRGLRKCLAELRELGHPVCGGLGLAELDEIIFHGGPARLEYGECLDHPAAALVRGTHRAGFLFLDAENQFPA